MKTGDQIALFPLDAVLFPQMKKTLRIAETRYQRMIARCIEFDEPFGVVLIRSLDTPDGAAAPYLVGTVARIKAAKSLKDGRMNVMIVGEERFRVRRLDETSFPYLVGTVEPLEEAPLPESQDAEELLQRAKDAFESYLQLLLEDERHRVSVVFDDAATLSFAMAMCLDCEPLQKQRLLELTDTIERFEEVIPKIEERVVQMRRSHTTLIDIQAYADVWFSPN